MLEVIPAILTDDPRELKEKIRQVARLHESYGEVKRVQVDIVDGVFAKNHTVGLEALESIETSLGLDVQLMTKDPTNWVEKSVRAMAGRIIGQIEMMPSQEAFVRKVTEVGQQVGLAIDLPTPVSNLDQNILMDVDVVLVMSVKAGFGGQKFDEKALKKIKDLDKIRAHDKAPFKICVDGGINFGNIKLVVEAGADEVAVGKSLFDGDITQNIEKLKKNAS
ncbi:hypothetical protein CMO96_04680 [Candidatus Woesebacteria bacterium]|nr:hypothetical protein [Candidatus Woesebacteria bacterium]|tara:strand:+ start:849 stop:1511 length:663 start_codon:yes stop_codon:yes gene_type:complete